jgi:dolichyl-phosphate-mannose--protein O-mannosyl transferase
VDTTTALTETWRLVNIHAGAISMDHPLASSWPSWLLPYKPIIITRSGLREAIRVVTTLGNPLIWWSASLAVVGSLGAVLWFGARHTLAQRREDPERPGAGFWATHGFSTLVVLVGYLAFLSPWVLTRRDPYIYHYLPCYALAVVLLSGFASWVAQRRPRVALVFALLVLDVAAFYTPVWARLPVTQQALEARLFLRSWR